MGAAVRQIRPVESFGDPWTVVTIANEAPEVMRRFVAWHLDAGAERILIYLDNPRDPVREILAHLPRVEAVPCTRPLLRQIGTRRSHHFTRRQIAALQAGYETVGDGWALVLDADELLHVEDGSIGEMLAARPAATSLLVPTAERVRLHGSDEAEAWFRLPTRSPRLQDVHRAFAPHLVPNHGLVGHTVGKSFTRAGQKLTRAHQHWMIDAEGKRMIGDRPPAAWLLHFYEEGYESWRAKLMYRVAAQPRGRRVTVLEALRALCEAGDERGLRRFYRRMHMLDNRQAEVMKEIGALRRFDLDLAAKVARYFPKA